MNFPLPKARVYVQSALAKDALIELGESQSHYLKNVIRLEEGDDVALFNGKDGEWWGKLFASGKKSLAVQLKHHARPQAPEPDIWLCFAPIKFGKIDWLVQKATEIGASRLLPIQTRRTVVDRVNIDRLQANVIEAAEQCERLTVPEVEITQTFDKLLLQWPQDRLLVVADETGGGKPPHDLLPVLHDSKLAVLIGPEGGFSPEEVKRLSMMPGVRRMSLGPRILRADTAALAALTCVQALCGDWRQGIPHFGGGCDV